MIGAVALVVLGPERLPKVARTVGEWVGKAQRYVAQVKSDISREMELAELKKLQEQARDAAQSIKSSVENAMSRGHQVRGEGLRRAPMDRARRRAAPATITRGKAPVIAGSARPFSGVTSPACRSTN